VSHISFLLLIIIIDIVRVITDKLIMIGKSLLFIVCVHLLLTAVEILVFYQTSPLFVINWVWLVKQAL